jgi:hypothetical protein
MSSPITCIAPAAAWAGQIFRRDHHLDARQLRRQRGAAVGAPPALWRRQLRFALCRPGGVVRHRLLEVFEGELQLVGIELLGAPAKLQLVRQIPQPIVLLGQSVALGQRRIAFGDHAAQQAAQRFDVLG